MSRQRWAGLSKGPRPVWLDKSWPSLAEGRTDRYICGIAAQTPARAWQWLPQVMIQLLSCVPGHCPAHLRMKNILLLSGIVALLATGCQSSSAPDEPTDPAADAGQNMMQNNSGMMAQNKQMAAMHEMKGGVSSAPAGAGPRAQAMRLHDAAMGRMDALVAERERLAAALSRLNAATPAGQRQAVRLKRAVGALQQADGQMLDWMHQLHEPDSTQQPRAQVNAYWQQQLPSLQRLGQRITVALDSAKVLR